LPELLIFDNHLSIHVFIMFRLSSNSLSTLRSYKFLNRSCSALSSSVIQTTRTTFSTSSTPSISSSSTPSEPRVFSNYVVLPTPPKVVDPNEPLCDPNDKMQVYFLGDKPEFGPQIAKTYFTEWETINRDYFGSSSEKETLQNVVYQHLGRNSLNSCLIGVVDGKLAAMGLICTDDTETSHPYSGVIPMLSALVVSPEFRGHGYGIKLLAAMARRAEIMGYNHAWLITQHMQKPYEKLGFKVIETLPTYHSIFSIMRKDFKSSPNYGKNYTVQDAIEAHKKEHGH
jgi:GNAT superfamily N-acetyltransferase